MAVGNAVENLLALPFRLQEAGGAQQPQVVRHQRLTEHQSRADFSHIERPSSQLAAIRPIGFTREPEQFSQFGRLTGMDRSSPKEA